MTEHKDWKRLVRERMARTGESYSIARRRLIDERGPDERVAALERERTRAFEASDFEGLARARAALDALRPRREDALAPLSPGEREAVAPLLAAAAEEARRWGRDAVEPEHLLLAALADGSSAAKVLATFDVSSADVARELERVLTRGTTEGRGASEPLSAGATRVARRALEEAARRGVAAPTTLDVLVAIADGESVAAQALEALIDADELREELDEPRR